MCIYNPLGRRNHRCILLCKLIVILIVDPDYIDIQHGREISVSTGRAALKTKGCGVDHPEINGGDDVKNRGESGKSYDYFVRNDALKNHDCRNNIGGCCDA